MIVRFENEKNNLDYSHRGINVWDWHFHISPDVQPFYFAGSVIAKGNVFNF